MPRSHVQVFGSGRSIGLPAGGVALVYDQPFNAAHGFTSDLQQRRSGQFWGGAGDAFPGGEGVNQNGDWVTSGHPNGDEITTLASRSGAGGDRGFRHWSGDGLNNNCGSIVIDFTPRTELWARYYVRYQLGFAWNGSTINAKDMYWNRNATGTFYFGFHEASLGGHVENEAGLRHTSVTWNDIMGGSTSDGNWHCFELYCKANTGGGANGLYTVWADNVQVANWTDVAWGASAFSWDNFALGENKNDPSNGGIDKYTDFDDLAISVVGRIGP